MSITCPECSIRYATDLPACPWCGHASAAAPVAAAPPVEGGAGERASEVAEDPDQVASPPTHVEGRTSPPPPPPPRPSSSAAYDLSNIPGPDEEWEPVDDWLDAGPLGGRLPPPDRLKRWGLVGLGVVALLVFGALLAEIFPFGGGDSDSPPATVAAPVTTVVPVTVTTQPPAPTTTLPPPTTTTTTPPTTIAFIEPVGTALSDLLLFETGIGDLEFGRDGIEAVGRLVATLGQPTFDSGVVPAPDDAGGICPGQLQRQVRWGSLSVYNSVGEDGTEVLASVRMRAVDALDPDPGVEGATLSGLQLGDTVADMRSIYDGFLIDVAPGEEGSVWEVRAGSDGRLLVWGTAAGTEGTDTVTSIASSLRCSE